MDLHFGQIRRNLPVLGIQEIGDGIESVNDGLVIRLDPVLVAQIRQCNGGRHRFQGKRNLIIAFFIADDVFVSVQVQIIAQFERRHVRNRKLRILQDRNLRVQFLQIVI